MGRGGDDVTEVADGAGEELAGVTDEMDKESVQAVLEAFHDARVVTQVRAVTAVGQCKMMGCAGVGVWGV